MSDCVDEIDLCVIRGDVFRFDIGLTSAWPEVIEAPNQYIANLVFRDYQDDDNAQEYLRLSATPEVNQDPLPDEVPVLFRFSASADQTQTLPTWDHVGYCEIVEILPSAPLFPQPKRLFNTCVDVHD